MLNLIEMNKVKNLITLLIFKSQKRTDKDLLREELPSIEDCRPVRCKKF